MKPYLQPRLHRALRYFLRMVPGHTLLTLAALGLSTLPLRAAEAPASPTVTQFKTVKLNGLDIFYREAGPRNAPTILLLHGFPTSSNMFRNLIPRLAATYHVVAPDYPGFGQSSMPPHDQFAYTFAHLTDVVEQLAEKLELTSYSLYVMDYGAPIGLPLGPATSRARPGPDRPKRQCLRRRPAEVLGSHQTLLEQIRRPRTGRRFTSWSMPNRPAGNTRMASPTIPCSIRRPGWWIKWGWTAPAMTKSSSISFTTTGRMSRSIRSSKPSSASISRRR